MQAIVLAGGLGSRLRPLTGELPKPMIPVANIPLLEHTFEHLKRHGIFDVGVTVMYLPQCIRDYFGDGTRLDMRIRYFEENIPLGTAGSVKQAEGELDETFLVISGDALTNADIGKIMLYHKEKGADVTVVTKKETCPLEFGVVLAAEDGQIEGFSEKPQWESVTADTVNTGIYIIEKNVLEKIPTNTEFDFSRDLFPLLMTEKAKMYSYITEDYWCDLGTPKTYLQANFDILDGLLSGKKQDIVTGENFTVSSETTLLPPVLFGKNVCVKGKCVIGPDSVIGDGCIIENSTVKSSVLWDGVVAKDTEIINSAVATNAEIDGAHLLGSNCIGSRAKIEKNACVYCGVKVFNNVIVDKNTVAREDVTAPLYFKENYFENGKISGVWEKDITPSVLEGLAASISGEKIAVGYSDNPFSASCAHLLSSFLSLSGKNAYLLKSKESSFRYFVCANQIQGIYIRADFPELEIQVTDKNGLNISSRDEKKINFSQKAAGKCKKVIRLDEQEKQFEYFLNTSFPFMHTNVSLLTRDRFKLHNIAFCEEKNVTVPAKGIFIFAPNGNINDIYVDGERVSAFEFLSMKISLAELLGAKEVFLPPYADEEIKESARKKGLKVLESFQHRGNTMQQAGKFNTAACLLEFEPAFFALAYCFYSERLKTDIRGGILAEYTFDCNRADTAKTVKILNKKSGDFITVVPKNDGCSFSVYGRFAREEYAPDTLENFVNGVLDKN